MLYLITGRVPLEMLERLKIGTTSTTQRDSRPVMVYQALGSTSASKTVETLKESNLLRGLGSARRVVVSGTGIGGAQALRLLPQSLTPINGGGVQRVTVIAELTALVRTVRTVTTVRLVQMLSLHSLTKR